MTEIKYPGISDRVKAVIMDSVVLIIFIIIITYILSSFENVPNNIRLISFVFVFGLYDPLFTTLFGGTIGHMMNGLSVRRDKNHSEKIMFHSAIIRFIVKAILGWISLLTVSSNDKRKAIHDLIVGSVVVYKK